MPITFDGKDALTMKCKKCGEPIAKKIENIMTISDVTYKNNEPWHNECLNPTNLDAKKDQLL